MTSQSVAYGSLLEEVRHNKAGEVELNRHNVAVEIESNRHNVVSEKETYRHNVAIESIQKESNAITKEHYQRADTIALMNAQENKRHNLVTESVAMGNLGVSQGQLAVAWSQYELANQQRIDNWNISTREFMYVDVPKAESQIALWESQSASALANAAHTQQQMVIDRVSAPYSMALMFNQATNYASQSTLNAARTLESYTGSLENVGDMTSSLFGGSGKKKKPTYINY